MRDRFKIFLLFIIVLTFPMLISAQMPGQEAKNWYFGTGTDGLVFDSLGNLNKVNTKVSGVGYEGMIVVNDPTTGELLFYSDGERVIDKNNNIMPNGTGLNGHFSGAQCVQCLPVPCNPNKYYLLTNNAFDSGSGNLFYSIVDFTDPLFPDGIVTNKNTLISNINYGQANKLVPKLGTSDYWWIGQEWNSNKYDVIAITSSGFTYSHAFTGIFPTNSYTMAFSNINQKLAVSGTAGLILFDFNPVNGQMSNEVRLTNPVGASLGNFSPDGTKLYFGMYDANILKFHQYDFTTGTITNMNTCCYAHDVKTAPNGKMYFIHTYNAQKPLGVINKPNLSAINNACEASNLDIEFTGEVRRFPEFVTIPYATIEMTKIIDYCTKKAEIGIIHNIQSDSITYQWYFNNNIILNQASPSIVATQSGAYEVRVYDYHNCPNLPTIYTKKIDLVLTELVAIQNVNITHASCGSSNGSVRLMINNGTTPYTFRWSNGLTTQNIDNLSAGNYKITVTDNYGCAITDSAIVNEPKIERTISTTDAACFNKSNGQVSLQATGGNGNYSIKWSDASTDFNRTNLKAGIYTYTITDTEGCIKTDTVNINQPLQIFTTKHDTICFGQFIQIGNYKYAQTGVYQDTLIAYNGCDSVVKTNLFVNPLLQKEQKIVICYGDTLNVGTKKYVTAGFYNDTLKTAFGCDSLVKTNLEVLRLEANWFSKPQICTPNGSIEVIAKSNFVNEPIEYQWSNGLISPKITNLPYGLYKVTVSQLGCSVILNGKVDSIANNIKVNIEKTHLTCPNDSSGKIKLNITGFQSPRRISWNTNDTTSTIEHLYKGQYRFSVIDANGCTVSDTCSILSPVPFSMGLQSTDVNCFGYTDGKIDIKETKGGTSPYLFALNNDTNFRNTNRFETLTPSLYFIKLKDLNGCFYIDSIKINQPQQIFTTQKDTICFGQFIQIGNYKHTQTGVYQDTLTAYNGCDSIVKTTLLVNPILQKEQKIVICYGDTLTVGTKKYTNAGFYSDTLKTSFGCDSLVKTNLEVLKLEVQIFSKPQICTPNGSLEVKVKSNFENIPPQYKWNNGQNSSKITQLVYGLYKVTISQLNCSISLEGKVDSQANNMKVNVEKIHLTCPADSSGKIKLNITGYQSPLHILWNTNDTASSISHLTKGKYSFSVKDSNGCSFFDTCSILSPDLFSMQVQTTDVSCFGFKDGKIDIKEIKGGTQPYTYALNNAVNFRNTNGFDTLSANLYALKLKDSRGCLYTKEYKINEPEQLKINIDGDKMVKLGEDVMLRAIINSRFFTPLSIKWQSSAKLSCDSCFNIEARNYSDFKVFLYAKDAHRCASIDSILIKIDKTQKLYVPNVFSPNSDGINDRFNFYGNFGLKIIKKLKIFNRWGGLIFENQNILPNNDLEGWDGTEHGTPLNPDVFVYWAEVEWLDGSLSYVNGDITLIK